MRLFKPFSRVAEHKTLVTGIAVFAASMSADVLSQDPPQALGKKNRVIEEVIVTSSKREESLMEVLGSVTALDAEMLDKNNIQDYQKLSQLVPGFVVLNEEAVSIRGISKGRQGGSPVAFHVNGVFLGLQGEPFYDLSDIEVVRGPSGTVFGRNATAGAINAKWKKPEDAFGYGFTGRLSTRTEEQVKAYINIPLFERDGRQTLARFAGMYRRADGTIDNMLVDDSKDPGNINDYFIRGYLTSSISDNFDLSLRAIHYKSRPIGTPMVRSPSLFTRRSGDLEKAGAETLPNDLTKVRSTVDQRYGKTHNQFTRVSSDINWGFTDVPFLGDFDAIAIVGYQTLDGRAILDLDGTDAPIFDSVGTIDEDKRQNIEFRLVSANDTGIEWIVGAFGYQLKKVESLDATIRALISAKGVGRISGIDPFINSFLPDDPKFLTELMLHSSGQTTEDTSYAVFLNYNFDMATLAGLAPIEITAGIRQNYDSISLLTPDATGTIQQDESLPPVENSIPGSFQEADFTATTGELGARWFYNEDGLLYSKISRGYKPGLAQNLMDEDGNVMPDPVDPEYLTSLELGWKAAFFDRALQFELAGYLYDYVGLQVTQISGTGLRSENAADATVIGLELGLHWSPTDDFNMHISGAAMKATYDEYCGSDPAAEPKESPDPGCNEDNPSNFSGETLAAAPELSITWLADYTFRLGEYGSLTPSIKISWVDDIDRRGVGNEFDLVEAYSASDARLTWNSPAMKWSVELFVENIEDKPETFFTAFGPVLLSGGTPNTFTLGNGLQPRVFGGVVNYRY